ISFSENFGNLSVLLHRGKRSTKQEERLLKRRNERNRRKKEKENKLPFRFFRYFRVFRVLSFLHPMPQSLARKYCAGQGRSTPSVFAALSGQYGSRNIARAKKTASASPRETISSACCASVIIPTAPVAMPTSLRMAAEKGTWYPGPSGIVTPGTRPPLEQ